MLHARIVPTFVQRERNIYSGTKKTTPANGFPCKNRANLMRVLQKVSRAEMYGMPTFVGPLNNRTRPNGRPTPAREPASHPTHGHPLSLALLPHGLPFGSHYPRAGVAPSERSERAPLSPTHPRASWTPHGASLSFPAAPEKARRSVQRHNTTRFGRRADAFPVCPARLFSLVIRGRCAYHGRISKGDSKKGRK